MITIKRKELCFEVDPIAEKKREPEIERIDELIQ